jgi:GNAT superfamily N-acetyltransferase
MKSTLFAPEPLEAGFDVAQFDCGEVSLNEWLTKRALKNEEIGGSRTYVVREESRVVGYYALAVGSIEHKEVPSSLKRNMPTRIPVMILGRLAIDQNYQGNKLGVLLLRDAVLRTLNAARLAGIKAIMVEAISDEAKEFYKRFGFRSSPIDERLLFITVAEAEKSL